MKIAIAGLGARLSTVATNFHRKKPSVEFVGYVDPAPAGLPYLEKTSAQSIPAFDTVAQMAVRTRPDMIMVGSPNHLHIGHLRDALRSDAPYVFTEKPVVVSADQTWELLDLMRAHGGHQRVMIGLVLRYSPLYVALKKAQAEGMLGKVVSIEASEHIGPHHGAFFMTDWRRMVGYSGGFMLEKCCHDIDLYQGVVGCRPRYVASFGGRKTFVPENRPEETPGYIVYGQDYGDGLEDGQPNPFVPRWNGGNSPFDGAGDIIDYQVANIEYQDGAAMAFHTNLNVADEYRRFAVMGTRGMAEGDFVRNRFKVTESDSYRTLMDASVIEGQTAGHHYGADDAMARDIFAFIDDGVPLKVTVLDALEAGLTALKLDEAMAARQVLDLNEDWQRFDSYGLSNRQAA